MSGKFQTIGVFTVSQLFHELEIVDIPDCLVWTGTNLENQERFYFPDASQISAKIGDHS